jgi:opacity protein-like surface antigen
MRRILLLLAVAATMLAVSAAAAWAAPPQGGGSTGCEAGQVNAFWAIGTGSPSGEFQAPYLNNPGEGTGPGHGFGTSESNTIDTSNCR